MVSPSKPEWEDLENVGLPLATVPKVHLYATGFCQDE